LIGGKDNCADNLLRKLKKDRKFGRPNGAQKSTRPCENSLPVMKPNDRRMRVAAFSRFGLKSRWRRRGGLE